MILVVIVKLPLYGKSNTSFIEKIFKSQIHFLQLRVFHLGSNKLDLFD